MEYILEKIVFKQFMENLNALSATVLINTVIEVVFSLKHVLG